MKTLIFSPLYYVRTTQTNFVQLFGLLHYYSDKSSQYIEFELKRHQKELLLSSSPLSHCVFVHKILKSLNFMKKWLLWKSILRGKWAATMGVCTLSKKDSSLSLVFTGVLFNLIKQR